LTEFIEDEEEEEIEKEESEDEDLWWHSVIIFISIFNFNRKMLNQYF